MQKITYKLTGIDCAACGLKVEDYLTKKDGIYEANFNFMFMKLIVSYEETMINEEEIEEHIHKSLSGVRITVKNNQPFIDTYEEPGVFKKIQFFPRRKK
jgi:cation transport ATPase